MSGEDLATASGGELNSSPGLDLSRDEDQRLIDTYCAYWEEDYCDD